MNTLTSTDYYVGFLSYNILYSHANTSVTPSIYIGSNGSIALGQAYDNVTEKTPLAKYLDKRDFIEY